MDDIDDGKRKTLYSYSGSPDVSLFHCLELLFCIFVFEKASPFQTQEHRRI
jgi:hypothetical protein